MIQKVEYGLLGGTILVPPSKSDSQRALLSAALAKGTSELFNVGKSADEQAMIRCIQDLGAKVKFTDQKVFIKGIESFPDNVTINAGESGLGLRLLAGICAVHNGDHKLTGEGSALIRPQGFFETHLKNMGAKITSNGGLLPLYISNKITGGRLEIDGSISSQFLSGLLMALPLLEQDSELIVHNLKSLPYVRMTIDTLEKFGIEIEHDSMEHFIIKGNQQFLPIRYVIEGDWSAASFWLTAAALGHDVNLVGLTLNTHQADYEMLDALVAANCVVTADEHGIKVDGGNRTAFTFDATHCPDLFPALVALAVNCDGTSIINGVNRLKYKESDRGTVLCNEFGKLGAEIMLKGNQMIIHGGQPLHSAVVDSNNDHRIAMGLAIAGLQIENGIEIERAEAVAKSYPDFWEHLHQLLPIAH